MKNNPKEYVGKRRHLLKIISKFKNGGQTAKKFASILNGEESDCIIGFVQRDTAKILGVKPKTEIHIHRNYILHMDNSGHFTGKKYGKYGHDDKHPLRAQDIDTIPNIIKSAKRSDILIGQKVRGLQRYTIARNIFGERLTVIEIAKTESQIILVSAYNLTKRDYNKIRKLVEKQNSR